VYGIHNNHDNIDEGERVKGDRGWEKGEGGRMERDGMFQCFKLSS
jgi:hypothetical protein